MKAIILGIIGVFICLSSVIAQNITSAEYFWDADPGVGNGFSIELSDGILVTNNTVVSVAGLSDGIHYLFVRTKDETGAWSHYQSMMVIVANNYYTEVSGAEYFWDTDPGVGNGIAIAVSQGSPITSSVTVTADVGAGIHYLHIRVRDNAGNWTHYQRIMVIVEDNSFTEIVSMEYFWDTDPGVGNATSVDIADAIFFDGNVPVSTVGLSLGEHQLYIRVKDDSNAWSHYKKIRFTLCETFGAFSQFETEVFGANIMATYTGEYATDYLWQLDGVDAGTGSITSISPQTEQELCLIASNACGTDTSCAIVGTAQLISVNPVSVPNNLTQTISLTGYGFDPGATVRIQKNAVTIVASSVTFNSSISLVASFSFNMETIGLWDVVVVQEDGSELSLAEALELTTWIGLSEFGAGNFVGEPYPNPVSDALRIPYAFNESNVVALNVYSVMGALIQSRSVPLNGKGNIEVDLHDQAAGAYFVELKGKTNSHVYRVLKD